MNIKTSFGLFGVEANKYGVCSLNLPNKPKIESLKDIDRLTAIKKHLIQAKKELEEYFSGKRKVFNLKVHLNSEPLFYLNVLEIVQKIPYAKTLSYKDIASELNNKKAVRAVGSANAQNPIPIIIPCHRVILSNGKDGNYGGGKSLKKRLINHEKQYHLSSNV